MGASTITIGELAQRSGVAASALRFYEAQGLIVSARLPGRQRRFARDALRRVGFIRVAQSVGLSLADIRTALSSLPERRTPTPSDWERLARNWRPVLQQQIDTLVALRDQLGACIGCGCLSFKKCGLYNPGDAAGQHGTGPRYVLGERAPIDVHRPDDDLALK
ncbi:MAG: redox-sensitive transcriptional activator SoxR [Pseudomonadota bacterium]